MTTSEVLATGKIAPALLTQLLARLPAPDTGLIVGPGVGEDAAVLDLGRGPDQWVVAASDPVTLATELIGHYALHVCANDLAVTGATPRYFLPTVLLPAGATTGEDVAAVFGSLIQACAALDVCIAGGHTEVTDAVSRPVVAGSLLGTVPCDRMVTSGGARPGDKLLLVGQWPVEAISLIAREKRTELRARGWTAAELQHAANYLFDPGISILTPALAAAASGLVTAMHDPTEGGIVTAISELAQASRVGMQVDMDALEASSLARRLCHAFGLNPLGAIASGSLLCTVAPENGPALQLVLADLGWPVCEVGMVAETPGALVARRAGQTVPWLDFPVDEVTKLFA